MKKATTHLRSAVPLEWRYRAEAVRSMRTPEGLWLPLKVVERRWAEDRYRSRLGREPELDAPRTFTEKILWRILYDRRQIWRTLRDKYRVRDFVRSRVGDQFLVPLLYVSRSPSNIPFDRLDDPYVVKPTHMSGVIYRCGPGQGSGPGRRRRIAEDLYWHLHNSSGFPYGVWPWYDVDPRIVIERMLLDARGRIPNDYKIHCFDGEPCFVQVHADRFSDHACSIYDRDFRRLDVELSYPSGEFDRPREWDEMLEVASALSEGLDYIRVDLYWTGDSVYVGEMTPYDAGGLKEFQPDAWDLEWGQRWTLPPGHRVEEERQLGDGVIRS